MLYYLYECVQIIDKVSNVLCLVGQSWYIIVLQYLQKMFVTHYDPTIEARNDTFFCCQSECCSFAEATNHYFIINTTVMYNMWNWTA